MILKHNLTAFLLNKNLPHPNTVLANLGKVQPTVTLESRFDMHVHHGWFNKELIEHYMQRDTVYISSLRHPFKQLVSLFFYHYRGYGLSFLKTEFERMLQTSVFQKDRNVSTFLDRRYEFLEDRMFTYFRFDYRKAQLSESYFSECLRNISSLFYVIITDRYDESLLLLRHKFCWDIKEILYITHKNASFSDKNKEPSEYGILYKKHKKISTLDYQLYSKFLKIHQENVKVAGKDFQEELNEYRMVKADTSTFCWDIYGKLTPDKNLTSKDMSSVLATELVFKRGKFWDAFTVTAKDCIPMALCELDLHNAKLALNYPITCTNNIPRFKYDHMFCANKDVNESDYFEHDNLYFPYSAMKQLLLCDLLVKYV